MARSIETRKSRFLLAALVFSHLIVISHQVETDTGASLLERTTFAALAPLQRGAAWVVAWVSSGWSGYLGLRGVRDANAALQAQVKDLALELDQERERAQETARLRELLELRQALPFSTLAAEVLARDGMPWFRSLTIGKGSRDGVRLDAPVISPTGVVGRVVSVGPHAAKVQLLLDRDAGVGALAERSRSTGIVSGQVGTADSGSPELVMKYVSALADIQAGDRVLTSGLDRIYPKGLVLGRVRSVGPPSGLFREVVLAPSARFDQLEEVLVVQVPAADLTLTESVK